MPTLYHITPLGTSWKILVNGLDPAQGKILPRIWLCSKAKLPWAIRHVAKHHECVECEMVTLAIDIPLTYWKSLREQGTIYKWKMRGVWCVTRHIPAAWIGLIEETYGKEGDLCTSK